MRIPRFNRHQDRIALVVVGFVLLAAGVLYAALELSK